MYKGVKKINIIHGSFVLPKNMKNIAIKNDNVGKKPITLSSYIYNFIKILKNIIKILFIRKPLEKSRGLSTLCELNLNQFFFIFSN